MSGGSLDYVYFKVEEAGKDVLRQAETPLHRVFGTHLLKVSKALKALEWYWSGDTSQGSEVDSIKECLGENCSKLVVEELLKDLEKIQKDAENLKESLLKETESKKCCGRCGCGK